MLIKTLIVDDERPARDELAFLISKIGGLDVCAEASSAKEAQDKFQLFKPKVVFLDIQMQPTNGIVLAKNLLQTKNPPYIVFATAYDKYAVQAFDIHALDYILKPFDEIRLQTTIQRVIKKVTEGKQEDNDMVNKIYRLIENMSVYNHIDKIAVWKEDRIILIEPQNIVFVETAEQKQTLIKTTSDIFVTNYTLAEIEARLKNSSFFRSHRSYLINLDHIKEIHPWFHNSYQLVMRHYEKDKIPVTRNNVQEFRKLLNLKI